MDKPKFNTPSQERYVAHLESIIKNYSSDTTMANSYRALKSFIDDLNTLMIEGIDIDGKKVKIVSSESLSSKDDKLMDRVFKFIDKQADYNFNLKKLEQEIAPLKNEAKKEYGNELDEIILGYKK